MRSGIGQARVVRVSGERFRTAGARVLIPGDIFVLVGSFCCIAIGFKSLVAIVYTCLPQNLPSSNPRLHCKDLCFSRDREGSHSALNRWCVSAQAMPTSRTVKSCRCLFLLRRKPSALRAARPTPPFTSPLRPSTASPAATPPQLCSPQARPSP